MQVQSLNYGQATFTGKQDSHIRKADVIGKKANATTVRAMLMEKCIDEPISKKGKELVKQVSSLIEYTWTAIKKGKVKASEPNFMIVPQKGQVATVKPIYNGLYKKMLVEVQNDKDFERMIINRERPAEYVYEKSVITKFGSATSKIFDSTVGRDATIEKRVNRIVDSVLPQVLKKYHL